MDSNLKQDVWNNTGEEMRVDGKYFFADVVTIFIFSNGMKYVT